jgi:hypothetical protein
MLFIFQTKLKIVLYVIKRIPSNDKNKGDTQTSLICSSAKLKIVYQITKK